MSYYVHYDLSTGRAIGLPDFTVTPLPSIEITTDEYQWCFRNQNNIWVSLDTKVLKIPIVMYCNYSSTTGEILGFYGVDSTDIPSPSIGLTKADWDNYRGYSGLVKVSLETLKIIESTLVYIYSDYGTTFVTKGDFYQPVSGEVKSAVTLDASGLSAAFPTVASTRTFTVTTNASVGDKVTMLSTTITMGTDVAIGSTIADTIVNLVAYMNAQERLLGNYRLTSSGDTFTLAESFAGGGLDVPEPTIVGTMKVSSGVLTESVWGYETQVKHEKKLALEEQAEVLREEYRKNYIGAVASGDTALAQSILADISTLNTNLYNAMGVINDE